MVRWHAKGELCRPIEADAVRKDSLMAKTKTSSKSEPRTDSPSGSSPAVATLRAPGTNSTAPTVSPSIAKSAAPAPAPRHTPPTHEQIAKRAYEIWISKGRPVG